MAISTEIIQGNFVVVREDYTDAGPSATDETAGSLSASTFMMLFLTSTLVPRP